MLGLGQGWGTSFGSGWISGNLSVTFAGLGYGGVLCMFFPELLTTPSVRPFYPIAVVRLLVHAFLVSGFVLGVLSVLLRKRKRLGLTGITLSVAGTLLGGSRVELAGPVASTQSLGLDWFLLNLLILALLFVPLERAFPLRAQQIFRTGFDTDLAHFAVSHMLVQVTVFLTMIPAALFFAWAARESLQTWVRAQPVALQAVEALVAADLAQYWAHRAFHQLPVLWRFHQVHHSSVVLDWLAGSRLHLVDIVLTRGFSFVPLYVLGFAPAAVYAYLVFVSFHAVFVHANVRFRFPGLDWIFVTPRYHHWHHAAHVEAIDRNFAVHLPLIDRVFDTAYLPAGRWPDRYGLAGGSPVPDGYLAQLFFPFRRAGD
jgi:sterol desaturase/sphingolipid hydroxylase (fatty acid hydroxylase superfamily)